MPVSLWKPERVEKSNSNLTCEWYLGDTIVCYRLEKASPDALNQWAATIVQTLKDWPQDKPYLAVHDLSEAHVGLVYAAQVKYRLFNIGITEAGHNQVVEIMNQRNGFHAFIALVFRLSDSGHLGSILTDRKYFNYKELAVQFEVLFDKNLALNWLAKDRE